MTRFTPPPNWPEPPPGWTPPPGWQPDPSWPAPPPGWNFWPRPSIWKLDAAIEQADSTWQTRIGRQAETVRPEPTPSGVAGWSFGLGLYPILAVIAVLALEFLTLRGWHPHGTVRDTAFAIGSIAHYAVAVGVIVLVGRPLARRLGGWQAAYGLSWPNLRDLGLGLAGAFAEFIARAIVGIALVVAIPALRHGSAENVSLRGRPIAEVITLLIVAILIAPPIEELIFRGLLLRTLLHRMNFWSAAASSSCCFALLHLYEVDGAASRILLFASIFVFGYGQCLLVRWTGRLGTSIVAHAATNAVGAVVTLAVHH